MFHSSDLLQILRLYGGVPRDQKRIPYTLHYRGLFRTFKGIHAYCWNGWESSVNVGDPWLHFHGPSIVSERAQYTWSTQGALEHTKYLSSWHTCTNGGGGEVVFIPHTPGWVAPDVCSYLQATIFMYLFLFLLSGWLELSEVMPRSTVQLWISWK